MRISEEQAPLTAHVLLMCCEKNCEVQKHWKRERACYLHNILRCVFLPAHRQNDEQHFCRKNFETRLPNRETLTIKTHRYSKKYKNIQIKNYVLTLSNFRHTAYLTWEYYSVIR